MPQIELVLKRKKNAPCNKKWARITPKQHVTIVEKDLSKNLTKIKSIEKLETIVITEVDKYGNENIVTISYKIKFIYSWLYVESSLSNIADNFA